MARKSLVSLWLKSVTRGVRAFARTGAKRAARGVARATQPAARKVRAAKVPVKHITKSKVKIATSDNGDWLASLAISPAGALRYRLYRPARLKRGEILPVLVMLHGCSQDAESFAQSTGMNRIGMRERCLVLYPQQDRIVNAQGCWKWYDTKSGAAYREAALIMAALDQVCLQHPADASRVAVAGLSAGASMAALLASQYPSRFNAAIMHSGVAPGSANSARTALCAMRGLGTLQLAANPQEKSPDLPPLLVIQGKADNIVAPANGRAAAIRWADACDASEGPQRVLKPRGRYPMTVLDFKRGRQTVVQLVTIDKLGHGWSGGTAGMPFSDAKAPDASGMIWAFAAKQFGS